MAEHLLAVEDFLAVRDRWSRFGNIGTCWIRTCTQPATDFIDVSGNDTYYFCHEHFMELMHKMANLPRLPKMPEDMKYIPKFNPNARRRG